MPLPVGTWNVNLNGHADSLTVNSTGTAFSGTLSGQPIIGFFNEADQAFTFLQITSGDASTFAAYDGRLFAFSPAANTIVHILAGTSTAYPTPAGPISVFGWSAQMIQKLKEKDKDIKDKDKDKDHKDKDKDIKDKDKDKEHGKDLEVAPQSFLRGPDPMLDQIALRLSAVEQQLAVGKAFITPEERPAVGPAAGGDKPAG